MDYSFVVIPKCVFLPGASTGARFVHRDWRAPRAARIALSGACAPARCTHPAQRSRVSQLIQRGLVFEKRMRASSVCAARFVPADGACRAMRGNHTRAHQLCTQCAPSLYTIRAPAMNGAPDQLDQINWTRSSGPDQVDQIKWTRATAFSQFSVFGGGKSLPRKKLSSTGLLARISSRVSPCTSCGNTSQSSVVRT